MRTSAPLVPVTVKGIVPLPVRGTWIVRVVLEPVVGFGEEKVGPKPAGRLESVKVTGPVKPLIRLIVTEKVVEPGALIDLLVGEMASEKSPTGIGWTTRVAEAVCVGTAAPEPVKVRG